MARVMRGGTRRRGRSQGGGDHKVFDHNAHLTTGTGSSRKQGVPGILSDSLCGGDMLCLSERAGSTPMKMLIDDAVSGDARHTSPGIVGRLMGLDMMPSFGVHSHSMYSGSHSQNMSPGISSDKYGFSGDLPHKRSTDEIPEFKDVFEVMEAPRMKNQSQKCRHSNICSGLDKVKSADMNFVRQKFMDAKRLSTDESFQRSNEFDDALEALVSNKDLLLEFLQESNHVPMIDLPDLSCSPFSAVNRITVLKPSRRSKFIDADVIYPTKEDTEKCYRASKSVNHSPRKLCISLSSQPPKEGAGSFRQKLSRSSYQERIGTRVYPTRIVVLKTSLEKTENMEGAFPLTHEMFQSSHRKPKAPLDDGNGPRSPRTEEYMYQMSPGESDVLGCSGKGSIEIAHEVTKQMRRAVKGGVSGKQMLNPDIGAVSWDEQAYLLSSMDKLKSSEAYSPTYSAKRSIRKEAKRRLSDRWKRIRPDQHPSQDANRFSTLGDMLALPDKEVSKFTSGSATCQKCPRGELHRDGVPGSCGYPLGISSNDGWKDENVCNSTRLKSLSSSSITWKNPKLSSRKENCRRSEFSILKDILVGGPNNSEDELVHGRPVGSLVKCSTQQCNVSDVPSLEGDKSTVTEREMHVNFEEPTCSVAGPDSAEERLVQPANSNHKLGAQWQDEALACATQNLVTHQEPRLTLDDHLISPCPSDSATQAEGNVHDQRKGNPTPSNPLVELVSHMRDHEDDQPSPVSVLASSLDAEDGCSGGFEKISADLQELRMQLRLLKMEATDIVDETELVLWSDDEISASCKPLSEAGQTSNTFWDADERDFSYVLDMLTCLGIQSDEQDFLLNACYLWECPAGGDIYESLEKKYSELILWPQSERRLLFDLTNETLVDVITCLTHCGSQGMLTKKRGKEGVLEEVWGRVCRQRRECLEEERLMGVGWLDCEDVNDEIVGEVGSMLDEDLLEEVIADLLLL